MVKLFRWRFHPFINQQTTCDVIGRSSFHGLIQSYRCNVIGRSPSVHPSSTINNVHHQQTNHQQSTNHQKSTNEPTLINHQPMNQPSTHPSTNHQLTHQLNHQFRPSQLSAIPNHCDPTTVLTRAPPHRSPSTRTLPPPEQASGISVPGKIRIPLPQLLL